MVRPTEIPPGSLLGRYVASGAYADAFVAELPAAVSLAQFVEAFYSTPLIKLERLLLGLFLSRPSTDAQARQLSTGQRASFAIWSVESRATNELVLAAGRTRSWLMVGTDVEAGAPRTRLFFGSAVLPQRAAPGARGGLGLAFSALLGFHKLYSRALLSSARARLAGQLRRDRAR